MYVAKLLVLFKRKLLLETVDGKKAFSTKVFPTKTLHGPYYNIISMF